MDRANLVQANVLYGELGAIDAAERGFDNGGVIISMEVSSGPLPEPDLENPQPPPFGARVSTIDIKYPPQMIEGIKAALAQRRQQIATELEGLGLTGVGQR